ncbi:DDB1- and CUL4-associated factor 8-like protein 2 isoform X1 [Metopolophium dirhodum]|uniref:DDB1- and CUL4-associated factor 8-like protein 2 isoform X1 n=1 Tax=Metopolophium dirhodum TaxID=44670 RepID=UPI00299041C6|nr:DDB1- and CUL4-associated factor 8-like protein 2 isoform X1 [Metopolophium dirhodum]XP_060867293.1 DDB1- and CUL4-associated factor 8-like protein 2 isoform X1 [Metopolophium dirhodum]XP_060867294.1 DDB1- and CUL4-associated factor 8-like protein 2 isoform X1 [Metopolophium dirhodum]XP_060867295.1 DDB1- and CUL4-associated factor 8-like protein 2 isoform X1 [Metopolophium dirhodum]XP_060867296.1 DDB1- and CUL4-associated factor 8-like protein 2 isoform X1 [Metopolophium dirhodum]
MSDADSDLSTDGDNNNVSPFFDHYLGNPRGFDYEPVTIETLPFYTDSSSESENSLIDRTRPPSSDIERFFDSSNSDEIDYIDNAPSFSSRNAYVFKTYKQEQVKKIKTTLSKSSYWCLPKELYNREIGQYNTRAQWGYKFYQSAVAVHKLKLSKLLTGHEGCVNSLDFNKTGNIIASGSDDFKICLWDWSNDKCLLNYKSIHTRNIFQTKFLTTHGDAHVVSSGRDGLVVLSAVSDSDCIYSKIIGHHDRSCNKVCVHHETPYVVLSCGDDGIVKNIDIRESPINENERVTNILHVKSVHGTPMHLYGIDINPLKPYEFIVNGNDEYIRMYDKRQLIEDPIKVFHRELKHTKLKKMDHIAIRNNRTDDNVIDGSDNSDLDDTDHSDDDVADNSNSNSSPSNVDSDIDDEEENLSSHPHYRHITSAVYSYCGTEILASYSEDDIYLFDANGRSNSVLHNYGGHMNRMTVKGVNFYGPRSDYVVSGSDCGYLFIWDKKTEAIVLKKRADKKGTVNVLEGHPHMPTLASSGLDKTIKIWEPLNTSHRLNKKKT